uniref:Orofacial cleft 1 candidate gene 1 protein n=1 Tax=Chinchilla lanigera TaxID=34839 RepID=A0A8C2UZ15_CHILA
MDRHFIILNPKFQQKALKQTKQKKSKSAEFLMVKEDREATEGFGNPAFNMSNPDLSAHQASEEKIIRRDTPDRTLAAHQQKSRLPVSAELKGNEYGRNYFDPLMDEEINPRQCGMEVSREDESNTEEILDSEALASSRKNHETHKSADEASPESIKEFERHAQKDVTLLGSSPFEQDLEFEGERLNQCIPMSCLKMDKTPKKAPSQPFIADLRVCEKHNVTKLGSCPEVTHSCQGAEGSCWKVEQSQSPRLLQIQIKCIRGLKDKAPQGSYLLKVSLLSRLGGCALQRWQTEHLRTRTRPVRHDGFFYNTGLYFHESLYMGLPQRKDVKPGAAFLFELSLLGGTSACTDQAVGWAAFPLCDNNFGIVEGKFKCPLLRGRYEQTLNSFREIEDLICSDLDHWLCNLYFQVIQLPLHLDDQNLHEDHTRLSPEFSMCLVAEAEKANLDVNNAVGLSEKETQKNIRMSMEHTAESALHSSRGSISNKTDPCPTDCDLSLFKEDHELHSKGDSLTGHSVKEKSTACGPGEFEDYSQDISYLEELEKHQFSVCSFSMAGTGGPGGLFKYLHFVRVSVFSELQLVQWQSQGFWCTILLMASLCFLRLCLHYFAQWLFLQAISTPVTKFHFYPYTVELCYPTSSLSISEELAVVVVGPLMLSTVIFFLVLIRWGCQLLFASCPDILSKLIIAMGLWTVLDPLAVFIVDTFLGRLTHNGEAPIADAAKLYWMFVRAQQPGILGVMITVLLHIFLFVISSLILYIYCLRLHNDSWILDAFQRIHSEETKFFVPYDLEISNQELSYIVKRSEQWRGINGERRKVAVYDYIRKSHGIESSVSSCDLPHHNEISGSAFGPGDITSHVSVYTVYPSGFQELYRHFLRLPGGAIIEVFGDISALQFVPSEVTAAIQERINEMDTVLRDSHRPFIVWWVTKLYLPTSGD